MRHTFRVVDATVNAVSLGPGTCPAPLARALRCAAGVPIPVRVVNSARALPRHHGELVDSARTVDPFDVGGLVRYDEWVPSFAGGAA